MRGRIHDERGALRRRTLVVVPLLLGGVAVAGAYGARMMLSEDRSTGAGVVCWNGVAERTAADCSPLAGRAGLAWVFPSFDPDRLDCTDDLATGDGANLRPTSWTCNAQVGDNAVRITYYRMSDPQQAAAYQERRFGEPGGRTAVGSPVGPGEAPQQVWRGRVRGEFLVVAARTDVPFAVEVAAELPRARDRAVGTVRMRTGELRLRSTEAAGG
ncbi:hypothetical protein [Nocardioides nanhaiensis]|uniref:DUF3558 domain-containing protein n=1 Tax=Nocardioides nanhaiensis TaxID=1476871 RepID=A0ABP8WDX5_9ACTN